MKELKRCQTCGDASKEWASKCDSCLMKINKKPKKKYKKQINHSAYQKSKSYQLANGAELLSRLNMTEYIQGNDMTEIWGK